jgi:hypothetical protein
VQSRQIEISTGARVFVATKGSGDQRMQVRINVRCESDS